MKFGIRLTGLGATVTMVVGTFLQFAAIRHLWPMDGVTFGVSNQILIGALGFGVFGVGIEVAGIIVSKMIVKWFQGKELALAMGLEMAMARMGTALALAIPAPIAASMLGKGALPNVALSAPLMLGLALLVAGILAFFYYTFKDKELDKSLAEAKLVSNNHSDEDEFKVKDIAIVIKNKGFWLIALLCVLFYSGVFPFLYYAADLMVNKYNVDPKFAGTIPSFLPFGTIILTP